MIRYGFHSRSLFRVFSLVLILSLLSVAHGTSPVGRAYGPILLGMTPDALQEVVPILENKAMYLGLIPGERFFEAAESALPDGVVSVSSRFYQDRLFKISVEYEKNWFSQEEWHLLVEKEADEYGKVPISKKQIADGIHEIARWEDGSTVYILRREVKLRFKEKKLVETSVVFSIHLDKSIWEARSRAESQFLF